MRWSDVWPRHIPPGLALTQQEYDLVDERSESLRVNDTEYRSAGRQARLRYYPVLVLVFATVAYLIIQGPIVVGFAVVIAILVYRAYVGQRTSAPYIRRALCELGYEVCLGCGYLLRGLSEETANCPECGLPRDDEHRRLAKQRESEHATDARPRRDTSGSDVDQR